MWLSNSSSFWILYSFNITIEILHCQNKDWQLSASGSSNFWRWKHSLRRRLFLQQQACAKDTEIWDVSEGCTVQVWFFFRSTELLFRFLRDHLLLYLLNNRTYRFANQEVKIKLTSPVSTTLFLSSCWWFL